MSFWKKETKASVNTAPVDDGGVGTAADVEQVMKKAIPLRRIPTPGWTWTRS